MPGYTRQFLAPFIGGLNTELPQTQDALQYTSDELNCTLLREGMRGRRYGFNIEKDGVFQNLDEHIHSYNIYNWANADADNNFIVIQLNNYILVYDDVRPLKLSNIRKSIDLSKYYTRASTSDISITTVSNQLYIVGKGLTPLVVKYNTEDSSFTVEVNNVLFRDTVGIDDGYPVNFTPSELTNRHLYNLRNQGWNCQIYDEFGKNGKDVLTAFHNDCGLYPSNSLQWFLGKNSSGKYSTGDLLNTYLGNTPAPKGHYILDYLNRDRSLTSGIYLSGTTDVTIDYNKFFKKNIIVPHYDYRCNAVIYQSILGNNTGYVFKRTFAPDRVWCYELPSDSFGGVRQAMLVHIKDVMHIGTVYGNYDIQNDNGGQYTINTDTINVKREDIFNYMFNKGFYIVIYGIDITGNVHEVYRKKEVLPLNQTTDTWATFYCKFEENDVNYTTYKVSLEFEEDQSGIIPWDLNISAQNASVMDVTKPEEISTGLPNTNIISGEISDVEAFGGRIFYLCGDTVLFSQTLGEDGINCDKCYQDADPTSEEISDVIATDGGIIKLLTIGEGKKLKSFYRGIIVFGDKEVDGILSSTEKLFSAVEYDMVKITNAGLLGKFSVVENDNNMFYWSSHGIYMISIDENNNISSKCISLASIQNWYNELPAYSKENCIGYFDYANNRIYWFYPSTTDIVNLDCCLVYDLTYNCFMPQQISTTSETPCIVDCAPSSSIYDITPTMYIRAGGVRVVAGGDKVVAKSDEDPKYIRKTSGNILIMNKDRTMVSLGDFNSREYYDWDNKNFDSYLVSRPIVEGDTYYNKQTPILQTLFKRTEGYKMLDKEDKPSNKYRIKNMLTYSNTQISERAEHLISLTRVLNTGIAKELLLNVDYSDTDIQRIEVVIRDDKDWNNIIGSKTITDVQEHNTISITNLDQSECNGFTIVCTGVTNSMGSTTQQSCNGTFYLQRTNLEEPQFLEYIPRTVSKTIEVTKEFDQVLWNDDKGYDFTREVNIEYRPIASLTEYPYNYFQYSINVTGPVGRETEHLGQSDRPLMIRNTANFITGNITTSFKDLKYRDRGVEEEKTAFESVYKAQLTYTFTIYQAVFKDENAISTKYTTPSGAYLRMRWGWSLDKDSNRWDMVQNAYRPQKDFLHDEFVESRVHIRGRGKAYQVEVRNDDNKDFRLSGMNIIIRSPN